MMLSFTLDHVRQLAADSATYLRGENYFVQGKVLSSICKDDEIFALVSGNYDDYQVDLRVTPRGLSGYCTCFMQYNCKHLVAVALHHLERNASPSWELWLDTLPPASFIKQPATHYGPAASAYHLLYQLLPTESGIALEFTRAYLRQDGMWTQHKSYQPQPPFKEYMQPDFISTSDMEILSALNQGWQNFRFSGTAGYHALQLAIREKRLLCQKRTAELVPARALEWHWQATDSGKQLQAQLADTTNWRMLETEPPCFIDFDSGCIGSISSQLSTQQIVHLLKAPVLPQEAWLEASIKLGEHFDSEQIQPLVELDCTHIETFIPRLHLVRLAYADGLYLPAMELWFDYGDFSLEADYLATAAEKVFQHQDGQDFIIQRDFDTETDRLDQLLRMGFALETLDDKYIFWTVQSNNGAELIHRWNQALKETLPALAETDWRITTADDFKFQVNKAQFSFNLTDSAGGWFNLALNLGLEGGEQLDSSEIISMWLEQGTPDLLVMPHAQGWLEVDTSPLQQIHSLLKGLILDHDLNQPLKLPLFQAAQLHELPELNDRAAPLTRSLMKQLQDFRGIEAISPPDELQATLRDYQQQGLNWLHFLYRHQFGGILADDMGLGKTLQVLTFIAYLKEQQQLSQPALVVAPTSLLGNWQREAARFTPHLKTHILHGTQRFQQAEQLKQTDIILTSYTLLHLDTDHHQQQHYSLAILDEAQAIKNPHTKTAISARKLNADMRLCLSGTPLENHLGELWSLMDFALPGLLYGQSFFTTQLRNPIERSADPQARQELARKIAPFILRRTKQQVAAELPEKTLITQYVELGSKQAALYESIRLSMEKRIRDLIDKKGMAKSRIEFLDALLKLRQACIAPQLVKLPQAANILESAKLDWLNDNLGAMIEEGRRILIFSQFTQALGLVENLLKKQKIHYSKLTGATRKRQEAIDAFQLGDNPIFLISLKAGGSGLNLTRADTVIHLDPWWNPAVENQATDRAHRIGQDKPVFVYKLVASGTVEERIQQMQEEKQALADALFSSTSLAPQPESTDDLLSLLAR